MTSPYLSRFTTEPSLIDPQNGDRVSACLAAIASHPRASELTAITADEDFWCESGYSWARPYNVVDGVLQIPVKGVLLNNFPFQLFDWATGYEYIVEAFKRGCGDYATGTIKGIAFVSHSPGGLVAGCFDAVDKMVELKEAVGVPVAAFAHEMAYSAAYAICGGVADKIYVSRTGGVGSIGVVTGHLDMSSAMEKAGLKFTYIVSDPSKVEGNPYEPLSADAQQRIQVRIDEIYGIFVAAVSRGRGLDESVIRNGLKAYCYTATQAVSNGLADAVGSLDEAALAFAAHLDDSSDNQGEDQMAEPATPSAVDQAALEQAVATAREEGRAAGLTEGAAAERTRIAGILGCEEAVGRDQLATHLAMETDMSVEASQKMLAASAKTEAKPEGTPFETGMSRGNPEVGQEGGEGEEQQEGGNAILTGLASMGLLANASK